MSPNLRTSTIAAPRGALVLSLALAAAAVHAAPAPASAPCAITAASGASGARDAGCAAPAVARWRGMRMSNHPSDGRTGGTPETSARVPGGPPDDVNSTITIAIPDAKIFSR